MSRIDSKQRTEFENWTREQDRSPILLSRNENESYKLNLTAEMWEAWQAAHGLGFIAGQLHAGAEFAETLERAISAEREACAKAVEDYAGDLDIVRDCADKIRSRRK